MRHYEAMFLVNAEVTEEELAAILEKYKKVVTDMGGDVSSAGKWEQGRRRLVYEIDRKREGMYLLMRFEANPDVPKELDRIFRISDDVFRHIVVRPDEDSLKADVKPEVKAEPVADAAEEAPAEEAAAPAEAEVVAEAPVEPEVAAEAPVKPEVAAEPVEEVAAEVTPEAEPEKVAVA
ncbi:MAG: 30S ribosomal protein S6 [Chthonomonadales bacterium]